MPASVNLLQVGLLHDRKNLLHRLHKVRVLLSSVHNQPIILPLYNGRQDRFALVLHMDQYLLCSIHFKEVSIFIFNCFLSLFFYASLKSRLTASPVSLLHNLHRIVPWLPLMQHLLGQGFRMQDIFFQDNNLFLLQEYHWQVVYLLLLLVPIPVRHFEVIPT